MSASWMDVNDCSLMVAECWRANGMPMTFGTQGRRIVDEPVLLAWFRARLQSDPVHQARMRALTHTKETP